MVSSDDHKRPDGERSKTRSWSLAEAENCRPAHSWWSLADPELQNRGGKFLPTFLTTFYRRFPKKFQYFRKKFHLSPKISDDLFLVIAHFRVLICWFSIGGPNP